MILVFKITFWYLNSTDYVLDIDRLKIKNLKILATSARLRKYHSITIITFFMSLQDIPAELEDLAQSYNMSKVKERQNKWKPRQNNYQYNKNQYQSNSNKRFNRFDRSNRFKRNEYEEYY